MEEFFADRRPDDLLLVHFSCHGVKDEGGELYFATANTKLRRLGATAVAADFVNRRMNRSRSRRVVLLLDCCYAGAFERGMTARAGTGVGIEEQFGGRGRAVITASSAMEYAFEGDELTDTRELSPSVFTSALVEGLETGEADRDQDGMVALDELYDYVFDKVRAATPNQTPGKWTFGVQGDLYIARRSRPVTTPAPLPPELQEAIDSPFAGVRAGAVPELGRLLQSRHAGLALAGRQVLASVIVVVAACLAGLALAWVGDVRVVPRRPRDAFAWLVVLLGVAGAVALFVQVQGVQFMPGRAKAFAPDQDMVPLIWTSAVALVVPAAAAVAVPRQFGVAVLAGWIGIGVTVVVDKTGFQGSLFAYTLLALVAVIIPFARTTPSSQVERAIPG